MGVDLIGDSLHSYKYTLTSDRHSGAVIPGLLMIRAITLHACDSEHGAIFCRWRLQKGLLLTLGFFIVFICPFILLFVFIKIHSNLPLWMGLIAWLIGIGIGAGVVWLGWKEISSNYCNHIVVWSDRASKSDPNFRFPIAIASISQSIISPLSKCTEQRISHIVEELIRDNRDIVWGQASLAYCYWSGVKYKTLNDGDPATLQSLRYPSKKNSWCLCLVLDDGDDKHFYTLIVHRSLRKLQKHKYLPVLLSFFGAHLSDIPVWSDIIVCSITASDRGQIGAIHARPSA